MKKKKVEKNGQDEEKSGPELALEFFKALSEIDGFGDGKIKLYKIE